MAYAPTAAPLLFDDEDRAEAARASVVASVQVSESARPKRSVTGNPVHSLRTLLGDLATIAKNRVVPGLPGGRAVRTPDPAHAATA